MTAVEADGTGVVVSTPDGDRVADAAVVATDPPTARSLTGVTAVPTEGVPSTTAYYAVPEHARLRSGRRLVLNADDAEPNAVVPLSAVAPSYAPDDRELLCATFLGADALDRPASALAAATRSALGAWYPERGDPGVETIAVRRIEFAQFAQPPGVHDDLPDVRAPSGSVYLAGEHTEWSSIQGAMRSGRRAAAAVTSDLGLG